MSKRRTRPAHAEQVPERPAPGAPAGVSAKTLLARLPLYEQIAADLRTRIESGQLAPGQPLPSETVLIEQYGVSRITVRAAVRALRAAGLVITEHGRGTRVADTPTGPVHLDTTVRTGHDDHGNDRVDGDQHGDRGEGFVTWDAGWSAVEEPSRYRTTATGDLARALGLADGEPVFVHERLLAHPDGARAAHTLFVPFAVCVDIPGIEADPFAAPAALYAAIHTDGHPLTWRDTITARMPTPDEAAVMDLPEGVPVILHTRTTHGTADRPLLREETRLNPHRVILTHTSAATDRPAAESR